MPYLSSISIFPIKSLDGVTVEVAEILASGALKGDREFAIVDAQGKFVNGKRSAAVHRLRSEFDLKERIVTLRIEGSSDSQTFHLDRERPILASWLSEYFGFPVQLAQNQEVGFPDDLISPGPTVVSTATLKAIADWFPGLSLNNVRLRFRTNLELADTAPFWEDQLFDQADTTLLFWLGEVQLEGVNPCQRCVVITRDAVIGQPYPSFQKTFTVKRQESLPEWTNASRFNHFYRLAVNTRVPLSEAGKRLTVGDAVRLE